MDYPQFYEEHIQTVIREYHRARSKITNGAAFVFITDLHVHLNGRAGVPLIRKLGEATDAKTVLCGGDFCWAWGSRAECITQLEDAFCYLDPIKETMELYVARGNHDATVRNSWEDARGYTMPYAQVQAFFAAHNSPACGEVEGKLYFYADDAACKTRYVILDTSETHGAPEAGWGILTGMSEQQLHWLCDRALQFEDGTGWSLVVMGHIPCAPELPGFSEELAPLAQILEAFKNRTQCSYGDFRESKAELIMYLCGHNHKDRHCVSSGVLHVSTGCDAYCKDDGIPRDVGSVNNTLFDLFLVDKDRKTIETFRIGAGQSRTFSY